LKKTHHKKGLVEWLKVKALSSNHSTVKKKRKRDKVGFPPFKNVSRATKRLAFGGRIKESGGGGEFKYDIFDTL
jgi:hypothetical protein